jgi:hypothetical protein
MKSAVTVIGSGFSAVIVARRWHNQEHGEAEERAWWDGDEGKDFIE